MIAYLSGIIKRVDARGIVLNVGGVGYRVDMPARELVHAVQGAAAEIFCHTHVREDALQLFGFFAEPTRDFFEILIGVSGVGPKSALAILSLGSVTDLRGAVERADIDYLTSMPGIGKKLAERLVLELRGKISDVLDVDGAVGAGSPQAQAAAALVNLGYSRDEARRAVKGATGTTEEMVRQALKLLRK